MFNDLQNAITLNTDAIHLTDEEFFQFCIHNRDLRFERDKEKNIVIMSPVGFLSSRNEGEVLFLLKLWNRKTGSGYVTGPSGGFNLPNQAMRAPDVAWTKKERIDRLSAREKEKFPHLCPDFVVEIRSKTDSLKQLQEKMEEWIENGCRLAWLIDVQNKNVYIYRKDGSKEVINSFKKKVSGEDVLSGFELELNEIKT